MSDKIPDKDALGLSLGAIELGVIVSCVLFGNLIVQTYVYSQGNKDRLWVKVVVAWCFFLETIHSVFLLIYFYELTVTHYGDPSTLEVFPWHFAASIPPQALAGATVQAVYSYRVYVISGKIWFAIPGWVAETFRVALSLYITYGIAETKILPKFVSKYNWVVILTMANSAVIDWANSALLCYFLRSQYTGYKRSRAMINKLIMFSIECGLFTSIVAILLVAFLSAQPHNGIWLGLYIVYTKVYSNSLLVMLNTRDSVREANGAPTHNTGHDVITIGTARAGQVRPVGVNMDVETIQFVDGDKYRDVYSSREVPLEPMGSSFGEESSKRPTI